MLLLKYLLPHRHSWQYMLGDYRMCTVCKAWEKNLNGKWHGIGKQHLVWSKGRWMIKS